MTQLDARTYTLVQQGECRFASDGSRMGTLLGSCLGIVFFDPRLKLGGMAHARLPRDSGLGTLPVTSYVDAAIDVLCARFLEEGAILEKIFIGLYGAASLLPQRPDKKATIGESNLTTAIACLEQRGLKPHTIRKGMRNGIRIFLDTSTGEVNVTEMIAAQWR